MLAIIILALMILTGYLVLVIPTDYSGQDNDSEDFFK